MAGLSADSARLAYINEAVIGTLVQKVRSSQAQSSLFGLFCPEETTRFAQAIVTVR
jgi:hypothetical protein